MLLLKIVWSLRDESMFVSLFKELNLASLSKKLLKKVLFVLLLASSSIAQALTLGDFVVDSFLDKPLKAAITVNGNSGDNLNTLEISMASKEEFKQAGIVRAEALDNFNFELVKDSKSSAKILVTTDDEVSDPYIHMLLKIRWNGGQLLREFTALIDPPLYSSQPADKVDAAKTTKQKESDLRQELKSVDDTKASSSSSALTQQAAPNTGSLSGDTYGPVQAGESLSEVAQKIQQDNPDLSIYQIMYVLFQNNQSAFVGQNINGLAKGSTLQVGNLSEIVQIDKKEGINFFYSQLAQWSANKESQSTAGNDSEVKVAASESDTQSTSEGNTSSTDGGDQPQGSTNAEDSQSSVDNADAESKPEFQVAASDVQAGTQQSGEVNSQVVTDLKSQIAELEASVESSKLESEELKETIAILESQLADSNRLIELNNQELASLAENANKEPENDALVATTVEEKPEEQTEPKEEVVTEQEAAPAEVEEKAAPEPVVQEPVVEEKPTVVEEKPEPAPIVSAPASFLDVIIDKIKELWQFIAIALVGLLGLIFLKMRSSKNDEESIDAFESTFTVYPENTGDMPDEGENTSDAKAEELIKAIKAETTKPASNEIANSAAEEEVSSDESVVSSIDMDALREATQSVTDFEVDSAETGEVTKESSFLTVYNDGDVVVNADEIDPIAEADVYIAYGREDQGEEVLLDGVKNFPDRNDIKIALLGLYVKSSKREEFDEIYQSLINGGVENNIEEWQSVEELKSAIDAKTGGPSRDSNNLDASLTASEPLLTNDLGLDEEVSNTDFIVNSDVNDLSEIDIKSESFDISEIDFSTDIGDAPVLTNEVTPDVDNIAFDNEMTLEIDTNIDQVDSNTLEIDSDTDEIESITIEVDTPETNNSDEKGVAEELDNVVNSLEDIDFSTGIETDDDDITGIEKEMSQIDFADDVEITLSEQNIEIDIDSPTADDTDAVDISAEISEISYNDEVSLTDVMELNINDVDLTNIPDEQDLTPVKDTAATTLVNDVDFVDDLTIDEEVTIDLTQAMDFNDDEAAFGNIDLDLGEKQDSSDGELPDGHSDPETQLDLAKVFLELDDVPGAVKILKELVDNGKVGEEAKELLAKHS